MYLVLYNEHFSELGLYDISPPFEVRSLESWLNDGWEVVGVL